MTTTTSATAPTIPSKPTHATRLTFGGIVKSEFIKLFTLRSTFWCIVILVILSVGFGLLVSTIQPPHRAGIPVQHALDAAQQQARAVSDATIGSQIGELVFAVLGALVITGEYGTGMIRSTFAAVPKRTPALIGKAFVLAITTFVAGLVTVYGTAAIIFPLLPGIKVHPHWNDWHLNESLIGAAVYLALIALLAFSVGAIIRSSAGGIAGALGLVFVLPLILQIVGAVTQATWVQNIGTILPTSAGGNLSSYTQTKTQVVSGVLSLDRLDGALILVGWFVVLFVVAAVLLKRRDA
jgi:ABC-2 type transport system permease protein